MEIRCKYCGKAFDSEKTETEIKGFSFTCPGCRKINKVMKNITDYLLYALLLLLYVMCALFCCEFAICCLFGDISGMPSSFIGFLVIAWYLENNLKPIQKPDPHKIISNSMLLWFICSEVYFLRNFSLFNLGIAVICAIALLISFCNTGKVRYCCFAAIAAVCSIIDLYSFGLGYLNTIGAFLTFLITYFDSPRYIMYYRYNKYAEKYAENFKF